MTNAVVKIQPAGLPATPSVLGNRRVGLQVGGTIRPGIKVLTNAAHQSSEARAIYDVGVANGETFDEIEKKIIAAVPKLTNPLRPVNVPYFTVREKDFAMPQVARQILERYGEDRGDGVVRLYRFPVVFAADSLLDVMPHKLEVYGAGSIKFWSEFSDDGERRCMTFAPVPKAASGKAIRLFGGRKTIPRPDTDGICNPENCPEYQNRQCNVSGRLIFYVPGITSVLPLQMPSHSVYGFDAVRETLDDIARMRGGRIAGFLKDREAFWLTKKLKDVSHIDENGRAVRVPHWIFGLEVMIDPTRLLAAPEEEVVAAGDLAASVLQGTAKRIIEPESETVHCEDPAFGSFESGAHQFAHSVDDGGRAAEPFAIRQDGGSERGSSPRPQHVAATAAPASKPPAHAGGAGGSTSPQEVVAAAQGAGLDADMFVRYAAKKWGQGWSKNPNGVRKALDEIASYRDNPDALADRMKAEVEIFF